MLTEEFLPHDRITAPSNIGRVIKPILFSTRREKNLDFLFGLVFDLEEIFLESASIDSLFPE